MINIIWDLDGTLIDSEKEVKQSLELALKKSGIDITKKINDFVVGPTIDKIILNAFPNEMITNEILNIIINYFRDIYDNSDFEFTKPYNGIDEIISNTYDFKHHIITNKPDMPTNKILKILKWSKYITSVNTPYTNINIKDEKKTKKELFNEVIINYKKNDSLFIGIGDMKSDCIAAKDNGITAIGVLWGTGTREELEKYSDYIFDNVKQLKNYLYNI